MLTTDTFSGKVESVGQDDNGYFAEITLANGEKKVVRSATRFSSYGIKYGDEIEIVQSIRIKGAEQENNTIVEAPRAQNRPVPTQDEINACKSQIIEHLRRFGKSPRKNILDALLTKKPSMNVRAFDEAFADLRKKGKVAMEGDKRGATYLLTMK